MLYLAGTNALLPPTGKIMIYVRSTDGALILWTANLGAAGEVMVWLRSTGAYPNFGTF